MKKMISNPKKIISTGLAASLLLSSLGNTGCFAMDMDYNSIPAGRRVAIAYENPFAPLAATLKQDMADNQNGPVADGQQEETTETNAENKNDQVAGNEADPAAVDQEIAALDQEIAALEQEQDEADRRAESLRSRWDGLHSRTMQSRAEAQQVAATQHEGAQGEDIENSQTTPVPQKGKTSKKEVAKTVGKVVAAAAIIGATGYLAYKNRDTIADGAKATWSKTEPARTYIADGAKAAWSKTEPARTYIADGAKAAWSKTEPARTYIADGAKATWSKTEPARTYIADGAKAAWSKTEPARTYIADGAKAVWSKTEPARTYIADGAKAIWAAIKKPGTCSANGPVAKMRDARYIRKELGTCPASEMGAKIDALDPTKTAASGIVAGTKAKLATMKKPGTCSASGIATKAQATWAAIKATGSGIVTGTKAAWDATKAAGSGIVTGAQAQATLGAARVAGGYLASGAKILTLPVRLGWSGLKSGYKLCSFVNKNQEAVKNAYVYGTSAVGTAVLAKKTIDAVNDASKRVSKFKGSVKKLYDTTSSIVTLPYRAVRAVIAMPGKLIDKTAEAYQGAKKGYMAVRHPIATIKAKWQSACDKAEQGHRTQSQHRHHRHHRHEQVNNIG